MSVNYIKYLALIDVCFIKLAFNKKDLLTSLQIVY